MFDVLIALILRFVLSPYEVGPAHKEAENYDGYHQSHLLQNNCLEMPHQDLDTTPIHIQNDNAKNTQTHCLLHDNETLLLSNQN